MGVKYRAGDLVIIRGKSNGRLKPNEIGVISGMNRSFLRPYTVFSISNPYKHDTYSSEEIKHLF